MKRSPIDWSRVLFTTFSRSFVSHRRQKCEPPLSLDMHLIDVNYEEDRGVFALPMTGETIGQLSS